ncbi:hypothetical protein [Pseudomonas sp.]|uniref:hypothetical protein n=1 Tax=Pseudomonas sp. TaxID=306 RepID=UPI003D6E06D9
MNKTISAAALILTLGSSLALLPVVHAAQDMKMDKETSMKMADDMKMEKKMEMSKDKKMEKDDKMMKDEKHDDKM